MKKTEPPKTSETVKKTEEALKEATETVPGMKAWANKEERRAALMRFIRSRDCVATNARTTKMPDDVKKEITEDPKKQNGMFELWASHDEKWLKVTAYRLELQRKESLTRESERYKTRAQLIDMLKSQVVADAIIAGLPSTHIRNHPNAKDCEEATQYLVDCESGKDTLNSHIEETGTTQKADIDQAGSADLLQAVHAHFASSSSCGPPGMSEEERKKKKEAQQAKAAERAALLETDMGERVKVWLKGINSDINKCQAAALETKGSKDKSVGQTYRSKFEEFNRDLRKIRSGFETATANHANAPKAEVKRAETIVLSLKQSLQAWNKIKHMYLKQTA